MTTRRTFPLVLAALALVLLSASISWYLIRLDAEPVTTEENSELVEQGQLNMQLMQEALDEQLSGLNSEEQERLDSPVGQALMTRCLEWEEFFGNHPDAEIERNRDVACGEYREFIATGVLPADTE